MMRLIAFLFEQSFDERRRVISAHYFISLNKPCSTYQIGAREAAEAPFDFKPFYFQRYLERMVANPLGLREILKRSPSISST
jgi:hypothetical protein